MIKCLDGAATLPETLASLAMQVDAPEWELVLADNGSTDGTQAVFTDWAARHPHIAARLVDTSAQRGRAHCVNAGIRAAKGERLLFVDADDTVEPGWLAAMARALEGHDFVAARLDTRSLNADWVSEMRPAEQDHDLPRMPHGPYCTHAGGATLGFHRHVFEVLGGFDPELPALEDEDFCVRAHLAGFDLRLVPDAVYNYRFRSEPEAIYRQARDYTRARALIRRRYADPVPRFAPRPWADLLLQLLLLNLARLKQILVGRHRPVVQRARFARTLGKAVGDLQGALAYGVAPAPRGKDPVTILMRRVRIGVRPLRRLMRSGLRLARRTVRAPLRRGRLKLWGVVTSVRTEQAIAALTFDDGPDPASTPRLLDALARNGIRATFFVVGSRAERHPELLARIRDEGHEIANHSWDHPRLPDLSLRAINDQIRRTRTLLGIGGAQLFRPPYGELDARVNLAAQRFGYRVVRWSLNGGDWRGEDASILTDRIVRRIEPGAIVLLHDSLYIYDTEATRDRAPTIAAVEVIAARLPDYRFVTVSELLRSGRPVQRIVARPDAVTRQLQGGGIHVTSARQPVR
jgi:peptidoglycan/xylan/chitin deacetylase (PgdA/CDA1 family)/glycosyltransferase involved in cell wall biosynthesis